MRKRTQTTGGSALTPHMFIDINESIKSRFFKSHIYITDGWFAAPPRGKREGHGKQNAHWPNGGLEANPGGARNAGRREGPGGTPQGRNVGYRLNKQFVGYTTSIC